MHFVASVGLYGIERSLLALLPALESLGWATTLVSFLDRNGNGKQVGQAYQEMGGQTCYVRMGGAAYVGGIHQIFRLLRRRAPTIVHVHGYKASVLAGGAALLSGCRVVATYHGEAHKSTELGWQLKVEGCVIPWFHGVMAVSEPIRQELLTRGVRRERIHLINNAVADPGYRWSPGREPRRLVTVGRLVPGKRVDLVIESFAELRKRLGMLCLDIVGDGPAMGALREQVDTLGLSQHVTFHGFVPDVGPILVDADCLVLASDTEGMPMVVLEAMALGLPVVATAVGSLPELADRGRNLLVVPPGSRERLSMALEHVLREPSVATALSRNARQKYERDHLPTAAAADCDRLYTLVCGRLRGCGCARESG